MVNSDNNKVYALIEVEIHNAEAMSDYAKKAPATLALYGGKYLVRGGPTDVIEGGLGEHPTKVILEFPSMAKAKQWYNSKEYQDILPQRLKNAKANFMWLVGYNNS